jgi:hypothetical protein
MPSDPTVLQKLASLLVYGAIIGAIIWNWP